MGAQFQPLTFELVEEGRFLQTCNEELRTVMQALVEHVKEHGQEIAAGAKAELNIKITLKFEGRGENDYSVKAAVSHKTPGRPCHVTIAMEGEEQDGELALFVRKAGSSADHPRQTKLATDDGRTVDPKTGKPRQKGE